MPLASAALSGAVPVSSSGAASVCVVTAGASALAAGCAGLVSNSGAVAPSDGDSAARGLRRSFNLTIFALTWDASFESVPLRSGLSFTVSVSGGSSSLNSATLSKISCSVEPSFIIFIATSWCSLLSALNPTDGVYAPEGCPAGSGGATALGLVAAMGASFAGGSAASFCATSSYKSASSSDPFVAIPALREVGSLDAAGVPPLGSVTGASCGVCVGAIIGSPYASSLGICTGGWGPPSLSGRVAGATSAMSVLVAGGWDCASDDCDTRFFGSGGAVATDFGRGGRPFITSFGRSGCGDSSSPEEAEPAGPIVAGVGRCAWASSSSSELSG
eukprot:m.145818 g.145818  ORF g.145818 m.145818 type:complete len:331 (-) comp23077_c0_seq2:290-1282(-)